MINRSDFLRIPKALWRRVRAWPPVVLGGRWAAEAAAVAGMPARIWWEDVLTAAPHPLGMYRLILDTLLRDPRVHLGPCSTLGKPHPGGGVRVALRHDLDALPERLDVFTREERALGLRSSFFVRVDGVDYDPAPLAEILGSLKRDGFEVGLHTAAYAAADGRAVLESELKSFHRLYGFPPDAVNTHGLAGAGFGVRRARRRLLDQLARGDVPGLPVLADHNVPGHCDAVTGDSHLTYGRRLAYLPRRVLSIGDFPPGHRVAFITHPQYWAPGVCA